MWVILKNNYLLRLNRNNDQFNFYVTNLFTTWHCQLDVSNIIKIFKDLNPMFEMKENAIIEKISNLYFHQSNEDCHKVEIILDGNIQLNSSDTIKGFSYKMELILLPAKHEIFYNEFTSPLIQLLNNFKEREKELVKIIEAKDVELEEYRLEGVEIKRRNVITAPFSYETFTKLHLKKDERHPVEILRGPLQELLSGSTTSMETVNEQETVPLVVKKKQTRVNADGKSISGTAGCLYSTKADSATTENKRKRKIPTRTLKL